MSESNSSSGGIGFFSLLAILFIALKLCEVIDWSWWWVLSPIWAPLSGVLIVLGCLYLLAVVKASFFSTPKQKEQMKRLMDDHKKNAGKSKWQQRMEEMQQKQKVNVN